MQEEAETVLVSLSRRQMERSPAVVVSSGHVDPLEEHPLQGRHVPRHRGEQEGDHAGSRVLEGVHPRVKLVSLALDRLHLVELVEVEGGDELLSNTDLNRLSLLPRLTLQNWIPRTELPRESRGGDQSATAIRLGTTSRIQPLTPDLAGKPT